MRLLATFSNGWGARATDAIWNLPRADSSIQNPVRQHAVRDSNQDVTELLRAWTAGDLEARDRAMALVYRELRRPAAAPLRHQRAGHTLQPTALVHEAYLRLVDQRDAVWQNRAQFLPWSPR